MVATKTRMFCLRLTQAQMRMLELVADSQEVTVTQVVRRAIGVYLFEGGADEDGARQGEEVDHDVRD